MTETLDPNDIEGKEMLWAHKETGLMEVAFGYDGNPLRGRRYIEYSEDLVEAFKAKKVAEFREGSLITISGELVFEGDAQYGMVATLRTYPGLDSRSLGRILWEWAAVRDERCGPGTQKEMGIFEVYFVPAVFNPGKDVSVDAQIKGLERLQAALDKDLARLNRAKMYLQKEPE